MNARTFWPGFVVALTAITWSGCRSKDNAEDGQSATEVAVRVGKVTRATLRARVDAYGRVEPEPAGGGKPAGAARLSAPAAGIVMTVLVKEGERVEAGTLIVKLDDRVALAQVQRARHAVEFAEQQVARQNRLKAVEGTSEKLIQEASQQLATARSELAAAQAQLAVVQLAAPLAGVVSRINVQPGQTVEPNTIVAEIIDPSRLLVTVNVPAAEAALLRLGQQTELQTERGAKTEAEGKVLYISPQVDGGTDTTLVRISLPPEEAFRSGQFVRARIITQERSGTLAVPREAVHTDHDGQSTLSIVEGDTAKQTTVKVGVRDGDLVEVEGEGIVEGTTVVTLGSYALPKETKVRILNAQQGAK